MTAPTLVAALGDEPLAPLVLARQIGAARAICVGRPVVEWRVPRLLELLRRGSCEVIWLPLADDDVPSALAMLERRIPYGSAEEVVFDLTNARGVVGIALYELARNFEQRHPDRCRLVRVDWSDHLIRAISPDRAAAAPLDVKLQLSDFLELHGKRLLGVERAMGSPPEAGGFGRAASLIASSIDAARPLVAAVHHGAWDRPLRLRGRQQPGLGRLIRELRADGVLDQDGNALFAVSLKAFQFLHGRWLEEYLFEVADASDQFDDCASGVRFAWIEDAPRHDGQPDLSNEIDFAGTVRGRATVASCKTGFRDFASPLYELLTLAERSAGRSVVTVFATTEPLDRSARHRAEALGVRVLDPALLASEERVLAALVGSQP